jgi:alpha-tubulin suppressor-like RCC1 family protein
MTKTTRICQFLAAVAVAIAVVGCHDDASPPVSAEGASPLSAGGWRTVAIAENGSVFSWGLNPVGDNTDTLRDVPVRVVGVGGAGFLSGVRQVSTGDDHSLALLDNGEVRAWGENGSGQLGDNTQTRRIAPVVVTGPDGAGVLAGVRQLSAGWHHSLAVKDDGTVWAWGRGGDGELGDNTSTSRPAPVQVTGPGGVGFLTGVRQVAAGLFLSVALKEDGTVWSWGFNSVGQLGDNTVDAHPAPVQVKGPGGAGFLTGVVKIAVGDMSVFAIKADGTVWAWGQGNSGQLGDNTATHRAAPAQVTGPGGVGVFGNAVAVAPGRAFTAALKSDGTVWAWGNNGNGELGTGDNTAQSAPVRVVGMDNSGLLAGVRALSAGHYHTVAVFDNGAVASWGQNNYGMLGNGTVGVVDHAAYPVAVSGSLVLR